MFAADHLLTDEYAERYGVAWLEAAFRSAFLHFDARGPDEMEALLQRIRLVADHMGDDYHSVQARWEISPAHTLAARELARQRGDLYVEAFLTTMIAFDFATNEPAAAELLVAEASAIAARSGAQSVRDLARANEASLACSTGDLPLAIKAATSCLDKPFFYYWADAVRDLSFVALLVRDEDALRFVSRGRAGGTAGPRTRSVEQQRPKSATPAGGRDQ